MSRDQPHLYFQVRLELHEAFEDGHVASNGGTMEGRFARSFGVYLQQKQTNTQTNKKVNK